MDTITLISPCLPVPIPSKEPLFLDGEHPTKTKIIDKSINIKLNLLFFILYPP